MKGEVIEDAVMNSLMLTRLVQNDVKIRGVVLDGYPSNEEQALFLEESAKIYLNLVVVLKASDSVCRERLRKEGLDEDCISKRLGRWEEKKKVLKELHQSRVVEVDAERPVENIIEEIQNILKRRA